ncbi:MAG: ornithine cyclodeaminase [Robiginitomaculum sp.]|nr:MAG: ornithine cyclodeaminase [Robiginitomaculum sp.]
MLVLSETEIHTLIDTDDTLRIVEDVFKSMDRGDAENYPVVRESYGNAVFGVKSGGDPVAGILGLKAGGVWPGNEAKGMTNHQSSALLFDPETGRLVSVMSGNAITASRTAAACAVSIKHLARENATTLGIMGAGAQAYHHVMAALRVRRFSRLFIWNRGPERADILAKRLGEHIAVTVVDTSAPLLEASDVIITLTPATTPILALEGVRAGTHIAAMGSDTIGKQEIGAELMSASRVFPDSIVQSKTIGECQCFPPDATPIIDTIGAVLNGRVKGRTSDKDITIFDGTGVALQDVAMGRHLFDLALRKGVGTEVSL